MIEQVKGKLSQRKSLLSRKETENDVLNQQIEKIVCELEKLQKFISGTNEPAMSFLEMVSNSTRGGMKEKIEKVVSDGVRILYGPAYSVSMEYTWKNNRSCLDFVVNKELADGTVVSRTLGSGFKAGSGGGMLDSVSVPLRFMMLLSSSETSNICCLDENYKHLDKHKILNVSDFLLKVSHELGLQMIMNTHWDEIAERADKRCIFTLGDNGEAVVDS